jgi:small subunit ribosomal protein S5
MTTENNKERSTRAPRGKRPEEKKEFDSVILDLARVTRVTKGGKRMRFRSCVVIGDRNGRVGYGVAKGADVQQSVAKATNQGRKNMIKVPVVNGTIAHEVMMKFAAAKVLIKPAPEGTGIKAGGAARVVLEMAGVPNVVAKIMGSSNKINNAKATVRALFGLRGASKSAPSIKAIPQLHEENVAKKLRLTKAVARKAIAIEKE